MGGLRQSRTGRTRRTTRPMALLSAVATLLAALLVCLGTGGMGGTAGTGPESREHHEVVAVATTPAQAQGGPAYPAHGGPAYTCPYDSKHCGAFPHLSPAVLLTAPQPPATSVAAEPQRFAPPPGAADPVRGAGELPRAPGRHVLQVMRT